MERHIGVYTAELVDDGTLDTVVRVYLRLQPHISEEIRFSTEYASHFRDDDGALTEEGWKELSSEAVDAFAEQRALEQD